jgi:hypothetical protein
VVVFEHFEKYTVMDKLLDHVIHYDIVTSYGCGIGDGFIGFHKHGKVRAIGNSKGLGCSEFLTFCSQPDSWPPCSHGVSGNISNALLRRQRAIPIVGNPNSLQKEAFKIVHAHDEIRRVDGVKRAPLGWYRIRPASSSR